MKLIDFKRSVWQLSEHEKNVPELENLIIDFFGGKPMPNTRLEVGQFVARARPNKKGEVFSKKCQLSYNKDVTQIGEGRANYRGQQVFYGALPCKSNFTDCLSTIMREVALDLVQQHNKKREYFTIGRWRVNQQIYVGVLPFATKSINKTAEFNQWDIGYKMMLTNMIADIDARNYFIDSLQYISDCFCEATDKERNYRITAAFYNAVLKIKYANGAMVDGLIYPSANTEGAGLNIVLKTEIVDNTSVDLDWVQMLVMQRTPGNAFDVGFYPISDEQIPKANGSFAFTYIY